MGASNGHCGGTEAVAGSQTEILDPQLVAQVSSFSDGMKVSFEGDMIAGDTIIVYSSMRKTERRRPPMIETTSPVGRVEQKQQVKLRQFEGYDCVRVFYEDKPGAKVVLEVPNETIMHVFECRGDFLQVRSTDETVEGWVGCKNVVPITATTSAIGKVEKEQQVVLRQFEGYDCVRVFYEDKPGAKVVMELPNETNMHMLERRGDFIHVRTLDETVEGWIGCKNVVKPPNEMDERYLLATPAKRKERLPNNDAAMCVTPGSVSDMRRQALQVGATEEEVDTAMERPELRRALTELIESKQTVNNEEVEMDDGARYIGQWSGNQINGYGELKKPDGASYEGYFVNGRRHGHGVLFENGGNTYEGEWFDDHKHGYGKYVYLKVSIYEGEWHHDQKSGEGTEEWADGAKYAGEYLQDCKHGLGTYWSGTGTFYKGHFHCDKMHGYGSYTNADKRTYVGQWENGHMNGVGEMRWVSGASYVGSYKQDEKDGEGTFMWADGRKYAGQWQKGKLHGHGIMTTADGVSTTGEWNGGQRVSPGTGSPHPPPHGNAIATLDCDAAGQILVKGSHVHVHGQSAVVRNSPDGNGCCAVTFDVDNSVSKNFKCNEMTKVPFVVGNHVVYDGCNGVILCGPDADGKFRVKFHMDGKISEPLRESQLTWATLQSKHLLPPNRITHGAATRILYHKTARGDEIRLSGKMLRGRGGAVGGGIYFAGSLADCNRKAKSRGWIVKAKVLLGRHMILNMSSHPPSYNFWRLYNAGFDSIELRGFASGTEYVVFSKDQVQLLEVYKEKEK